MEPANHLLRDYSRSLRKQTTGLTDELFLRCGVLRALEVDESGRAFLQTLADQPQVATLAKSTWFDAFQSARRLRLVDEVATKSYHHFERQLQDRRSGRLMAIRSSMPLTPSKMVKARTCLPA